MNYTQLSTAAPTIKTKNKLSIKVCVGGSLAGNTSLTKGSVGGLGQPAFVKNLSNDSSSSNESICRKLRERFVHLDRFNRVEEIDEEIMAMY